MLPTAFPPFPERKDFELYATMNPAKEVGGDFYDYYLVDDNHLCLTIADVSDKGVPAALFMMISKALLKNSILSGASPAEAMYSVNNMLCNGNSANMFVTVWIGIVDLATGKMTAANAGHEYPALKQSQEGYQLFKDQHGLPLGFMEETPYENYELELGKGDEIFVFTDGVTEATDAENQLFGTERLLPALNDSEDYEKSKAEKETEVETAKVRIEMVKTAIAGFVKEAPQFDDTTMLYFKIK